MASAPQGADAFCFLLVPAVAAFLLPLLNDKKKLFLLVF
jgi:hypothetical protein